MISDLSKVRNIGISAHIDSGKTTLTERILFYTKRIHAIHEVKGKDGVGATMDSWSSSASAASPSSRRHPLRRGRTTTSTSSTRPGHVDFTIEVERSLRVLDGAILVLCAVAGVQSQSITVDRQMRRYNVPRLAFVNKCDRTRRQPAARRRPAAREAQAQPGAACSSPSASRTSLEGVVDLVTMKALCFDGANGETIIEEEIPAKLRGRGRGRAREEMLDAVSMFSDELTEAMLEERGHTEELVHDGGPQGHDRRIEMTPGAHGLGLQEQGRAAAARRRRPATCPTPTEVVNEAVELCAGTRSGSSRCATTRTKPWWRWPSSSRTAATAS